MSPASGSFAVTEPTTVPRTLFSGSDVVKPVTESAKPPSMTPGAPTTPVVLSYATGDLTAATVISRGEPHEGERADSARRRAVAMAFTSWGIPTADALCARSCSVGEDLVLVDRHATAEAVGEKHGVSEKELKQVAPRIKSLTKQFAEERKAGKLRYIAIVAGKQRSQFAGDIPSFADQGACVSYFSTLRGGVSHR